MLIAVNYAPHPSQCYLILPFQEIKKPFDPIQGHARSACYIREGMKSSSADSTLDLQPGRITFSIWRSSNKSEYGTQGGLGK